MMGFKKAEMNATLPPGLGTRFGVPGAMALAIAAE